MIVVTRSVALVGADDKLRDEFVRQGIKVISVKLGIRAGLEVGF